jgi:hypothetical protein
MTTSPRDQLERLRALRRRVEALNNQIEENLEPFLHPNRLTFFHKPKSQEQIEEESVKEKADVATTATVLMALSMRAAGGPGGGSFFYADAGKGLERLYREQEWGSAGLKDGNYFTTALVLRATGFLRHSASGLAVDALTHGGDAPQSIFRKVASKDPEHQTVGADSPYPISPALAYWLMDAAERLSCELSGEAWRTWSDWASRQFHIQLANVVSDDDAKMDPIALAMAACLISKLRSIAADSAMATFPRDAERTLPSREQLVTAMGLLFSRQGKSGIWPKYFPLFIYPNGHATNHCFTSELLEAVLSEFSREVMGSPEFLSKIEASVSWCERNRLRYAEEESSYYGWNSGSNLEGLSAGRPECWATAAVHMFLYKLAEVLNSEIRAALLTEYEELAEKKNRWASLLSSYVHLLGQRQDVKVVLGNILESWDKNAGGKRKRSALLFGPPGTSKTSYVKHLAAHYGWPCVAINPSHFLRDGLECIFGRANEIFDDLMDMSRVVVFFDEMDPLVQKREAGSDIHHQSLTTVFLPKLADLYNRNKVAFFMATNHIQQIDPAIRRPGRFDYLLFVGPPRWQDKFKALTAEDPGAQELLNTWTTTWLNEAESIVPVLDRFTYDETSAFFERIRSEAGDRSLCDGLRKLDAEGVKREALDWSQKYIVLWDREGAHADDYVEFLRDKGSSRG